MVLYLDSVLTGNVKNLQSKTIFEWTYYDEVMVTLTVDKLVGFIPPLCICSNSCVILNRLIELSMDLMLLLNGKY